MFQTLSLSAIVSVTVKLLQGGGGSVALALRSRDAVSLCFIGPEKPLWGAVNYVCMYVKDDPYI